MTSDIIYQQKQISLKARPRGFHLVTDEVVTHLPFVADIKVGLLHLFLLHTSASLGVNENADPSVRVDMESHINRFVPEAESYYTHTLEGDDDMPAHIKSGLFGVDLTLPISDGRLSMGTWQGIYLGEHRNHGGSRRIMATAHGSAFI